MSRSLLAALIGSVLLHLVTLMTMESRWTPDTPSNLSAELQLLPRPAAVEAAPIRATAEGRAKAAKRRTPSLESAVAEPSAAAVEVTSTSIPELPMQIGQEHGQSDSGGSPPTPDPLPSRGIIRFTVYRGLEDQEIGRATHEWTFGDGAYQLRSLTETTGLARLLRPVSIEQHSRGKVKPRGLEPMAFSTRRNGVETEENALFDWENQQLTMAGKIYGDVTPGAQDFLSFFYQLAYLPNLADGASMSVATGKKFQNYRFDAMGEDVLEIPAGTFRVLHLRVQLDSTIDLWLALDKGMLPVKIRFTDRKGETFEQIANAIGTPEE